MEKSELFIYHKKYIQIYRDLLNNFSFTIKLSKDKTTVEDNLDNICVILKYFIKALEEEDIESFIQLEPLLSTYIKVAS